MVKVMSRIALFSLLVVVLSIALIPAHSTQAQQGDSPLTRELDPTPIIEWVNLIRERVMVDRVNAPAAARIYAYAGVTIYEALIPGMPDFRSLSFQAQDLPEMPFVSGTETFDWLTLANAALSVVMPGMINFSDETRTIFTDYRNTQADARAEVVGAEVVERSMIMGDQFGTILLEWALADGYGEARALNADYELPTAAELSLSAERNYLYEQTDKNIALAEPNYGMLRTLGVDSRYDCIVQDNMPFSTDPDSTFHRQALEVFEVGNDLTPEQREIAEFWIDTPGISSTPAGHWISIANQLIVQMPLTLDRGAMMYGMLGMVLQDSFITGFGIKYENLLLRPVTYINRYIARSWRSYLVTPQFPEYPSNHSVGSAAASDILTRLFGVVAFTDETHARDSGVVRSYLSFEQAADEAALSRIYGGIHYRTAVENGKRIGRCIAERTLNNIVLLPIEQGE